MIILNALWKFVAAVIVSIPTLVIGIPWTIVAAFYKAPVKKGFKYLWDLFIAILTVVAYLIEHVAIALDILWNVAAGEMLEDIFSKGGHTTFGSPHITVSGSIGKLKLDDNLTKFGLWFDEVLSFVFNEKEHGVNAYHKHEINRKFDKSIERIRKKKENV